MLTTTGRRLHPALDLDGERLILARVADDGGAVEILTSDRQALDPAELKDRLLFEPRPWPDLAGRWPGEDVLAFLTEPPAEAPRFSDALALTVHALGEAMEFQRPEHRALVATWSLATYFYPMFLTFPRLAVTGESDCGKSKLLTLIRATAWNALYLLDPTPAVLFRLVHEFRPTLLVDEVEKLHADEAREVLAVVNAGYKAGATVPRVEGDKARRVELFSVYSPMALAGIRGVNSVTESRCISLIMTRGTDRARVNLEVDVGAPLYRAIRDLAHRLLLLRWRDVATAYQKAELPTWLNARARELWKPLLAVAAVADSENGLKVAADLLALARDHVRDRDTTTVEAEALVAVLSDRLGLEEKATIRPGELTEELRKRLGWRDAPTPETVGRWLRRLGVPRGGRDRDGAFYRLTRDQLNTLRTRLGLDGEGGMEGQA